MISCKDNTNIWFFAFRNFRKVGKFEAYTECQKAKSASASEGVCLLTPSPSWALPLDPAGAPTPDPRYCARHGMGPCPSPQICGLEPSLSTPTSDNHTQCQGATYCTSFLQDNTPSPTFHLTLPSGLSLRPVKNRGKVLLRVYIKTPPIFH